MFPKYPKNNQLIQINNRLYKFHLGLDLPDLEDLVIRVNHGSWVATTDFWAVKSTRNPTNQDNPTAFMNHKHLGVFHWINTDRNARFSWSKTNQYWHELDD